MTTPELLEFIRIEHALGMSLDEIVRLLVAEGDWDTTDIAEAFRALGLPEAAVARYANRMAGISVPEISTPTPVSQSTVPPTQVTQHAPSLAPAAGPAPMEYPKHAAPMHYVERPEVRPKPVLARPAQLLNHQSARPLVRTALEEHKELRPKMAPFVHVTKVARPVSTKSVPRVQSTPTPVAPIVPIQPLATSVPAPKLEPLAPVPTLVAAAKAEPKLDPITMVKPMESVPVFASAPTPAHPVSSELTSMVANIGGEVRAPEPAPKRSFINQKAAAQAIAAAKEPKPSPFASAVSSPEVKIEEMAPAAPSTPSSPAVLSGAKELGFDKEIVGAPVYTPTPKLTDATPAPKPEIAPAPKVEPKPELAPTPKFEVKEIEAPKLETSPDVAPAPKPEIASASKVESKPELPPVQKLDVTETEMPKPVTQPQPVLAPIVSPLPPPPAAISQPSTTFAPSFSSPDGPPPLPPESDELVVGHPYLPLATSVPAPTPVPAPVPAPVTINVPPPAGSTPPPPVIPVAPTAAPQPQIIINMPAYGMPGQMPIGMSEQLAAMFGQAMQPKEPVLKPTTMYGPANASAEPITIAPTPVAPKKKEPIKFDIARVRDARKTPMLSAISGLSPVASSSVEEAFRSRTEGEEATGTPLEKGAVVHSMKVPRKRTMAGDLVRIQEGILPQQVVAGATETHAISGVAMPEAVAGPSAVVPEVDEVPPPPPKKRTASLLGISLAVVGLLCAVAGGVAYFLFFRLPPAQTIVDQALAQVIKSGGFSYEATLSTNATSSEAVPELLSVSLSATGSVMTVKGAFGDAIHTGHISIDHEGAPQPTHLGFSGTLRVIGDDIYLEQNAPTLNTPIETLLDIGEWTKLRYSALGSTLGLAPTSSVPQDAYVGVAGASSLSSILSKGLPITPDGSVKQFTEGKTQYYRVGLLVDGAKAVAFGDAIDKYLRGSAAVVSSPERAAKLIARYKFLHGELVVDKLLQRPVSLTLDGRFDPSKIPFDGVAHFSISFKFGPQAKVESPIPAATLEELRTRKSDAAANADVIARDAPLRAVLPIVVLGLRQYGEKNHRYPLLLTDLLDGGFVGKDALSADILSRVSYASYVDVPQNGMGARCTKDSPHCTFYHVGISLEYKNAPELATDADFTSPAILGADSTGCRGEADRSCYDLVGNLNTPQ